jgi:hypothetical protein
MRRYTGGISRAAGTTENAGRDHGRADHDAPWSVQQFGLPHATAGCVCTERTIAVPVPSASTSKARIRVVIFMLFFPKREWLNISIFRPFGG